MAQAPRKPKTRSPRRAARAPAAALEGRPRLRRGRDHGRGLRDRLPARARGPPRPQRGRPRPLRRRERRRLRHLAAGQRDLAPRDVRRAGLSPPQARFGDPDRVPLPPRPGRARGAGRAARRRWSRKRCAATCLRAAAAGATWPWPSSSSCPPGCSTTPACRSTWPDSSPRAGRRTISRACPAPLHVMAVDLDSGEAVAFGEPGRAAGLGLESACRPPRRCPASTGRCASTGATTWTAPSRRRPTSTWPSRAGPTSSSASTRSFPSGTTRSRRPPPPPQQQGRHLRPRPGPAHRAARPHAVRPGALPGRAPRGGHPAPGAHARRLRMFSYNIMQIQRAQGRGRARLPVHGRSFKRREGANTGGSCGGTASPCAIRGGCPSRPEASPYGSHVARSLSGSLDLLSSALRRRAAMRRPR